jgi:hypothetical protein
MPAPQEAVAGAFRATTIRAIVEDVIRSSWRAGRGLRLTLITTLAVVLVGSLITTLFASDLAESLRAAHLPLPGAEIVSVHARPLFTLLGFFGAFTSVIPAMADELRPARVTFHLGRGVGVGELMLGTLVAMLLVLGIPLLAGPLVLSAVQLEVLRGSSAALDGGALVAVIGHGLVSCIAITLVACGVAGLVGSRSMAQAVFAVYYLATAALTATAPASDLLGKVALLSVGYDLDVLGGGLGAAKPVAAGAPPALAALAVVALSAVGLLMVHRRITESLRA